MAAMVGGGTPIKKPVTTIATTTAGLARRDTGGCWRVTVLTMAGWIRSSETNSQWSTAQSIRRPTAATGARWAMKSRYGIRENEPMSMFCGLPVMLATLPIFEAVATARRYGSGLMPIRRVSASTIGTMTRQMMSLTKNADSTPLVKMTVGNRW